MQFDCKLFENSLLGSSVTVVRVLVIVLRGDQIEAALSFKEEN